ncbi:hypothetical protein ACFWII_38745 [Streptomyces sp. NPDC127063]|uniref:hypothetical protein n=1 Tax=Streptomyces sp. NPDC127063 TaxID=3347123 RepID=UPI003666F3B0
MNEATGPDPRLRPRSPSRLSLAPSKKNLERIEEACRAVRRQSVAHHLLARLNRGGCGIRVESHPLNQSQVSRLRQRAS